VVHVVVVESKVARGTMLHVTTQMLARQCLKEATAELCSVKQVVVTILSITL
jgi:hypothetical protein